MRNKTFLPQMSGFTVCEKLKEDPKTATVPIIFLTARSDIDSIDPSSEVLAGFITDGRALMRAAG
jgi:CheY-like chemotaxis protein